MEDIEKYYPALRKIVSEYDSLKKRDKIILPSLAFGSLIVLVFPPIAIPCILLFIYWYWSWQSYSRYLCPKCKKPYFNWFLRSVFFITSNSRSWACKKCGLKVCDLPELEYHQKPASHKEEWYQ